MYIRIATLLLSLGGLLLAADVTGRWTFTGTVEGNQMELVVSASQGDLRYSDTISSATQMSGRADYPEIGDTTWKATKDK